MSEHTPTPWIVSSAICGKHDTETVSIYHYPHEAACYEVVETGCKCGDEALTEDNASHIVHCVNNYERMYKALESWMQILDAEKLGLVCHSAKRVAEEEAKILFAELESSRVRE